jgi:hypothetical protein
VKRCPSHLRRPEDARNIALHANADGTPLSFGAARYAFLAEAAMHRYGSACHSLSVICL